MRKSILKDKSYDFAILIVKLSQFLNNEKRESAAMTISSINTTKSIL